MPTNCEVADLPMAEVDEVFGAPLAPVDGVGELDEATRLALRQQILDIERTLLAMVDDQVEIEPKHYFADGLYAREILIPKGTLAVGKLHKTNHLTMIAKGDVSVLSEQGVRRIVGPQLFYAPMGAKRVGFAHEDTVWIEFHATPERDVEKLERELIAADYAELEALEHRNDIVGQIETEEGR